MNSLRIWTIVWLTIVTGYTFGAKFYPGPGREFVNHWGPASVGYEIFFMLCAFLIWPKRAHALPIAVSVLTATCILEFLQLWQPDWLQSIRATFLGEAILGTSFSWLDFPAYFVGCGLGFYLLCRLSSVNLTGDSNVNPEGNTVAEATTRTLQNGG